MQHENPLKIMLRSIFLVCAQENKALRRLQGLLRCAILRALSL
ncbi:hypothetical protein FHY11_001399 [Xanthomonas arboricola]|nr:hypothetical protein [Xanthomonas euroxanthea]